MTLPAYDVAMPRTHHLDDSRVHYTWDNAIPPLLEVDPGDTVVFVTRDSADYEFTRDTAHADLLGPPRSAGIPLSGPVFVRGAEPGDALAVTVLSVRPRFDCGWTAIRPPHYGLLPHDEFPRPFLQVWDLADPTVARMDSRVAIPTAPFPGQMGVAFDTPGPHPTLPPGRNGGNLDTKQLTAGSTLYLPVWVPGALFSTGDAHAAQGDGECVTAIEIAAEVTLSFDIARGARIAEPRLRTAGPIGAATNTGPWFATMSAGPDLYENARQAIRYMIDHLVDARGFSREEAYVLCSVAVDLKISEVVDAPNWVVSAFLPESIFV